MLKIQNQKHGTLTENELMDLLRLLGKAGYTTTKRKEYPPGKQSGTKVWCIEYSEN